MSQLRSEITQIVNEVIKADPPIEDGTKSLYEVGLDSLDFSSVLMAIEDKYEFQFSEEDLDDVRSIDDICRLVEHKRSS